MLWLCVPSSPPAAKLTHAMPYALPAAKLNASAVAKLYILNTYMELPVDSLSKEEVMVASILDLSQISNNLNPGSCIPLKMKILHNFLVKFCIQFSFS